MIDRTRALVIIDEMLKQVEQLQNLTRETGDPDFPPDVLFVQMTVPIKGGLEILKKECERSTST